MEISFMNNDLFVWSGCLFLSDLWAGSEQVWSGRHLCEQRWHLGRKSVGEDDRGQHGEWAEVGGEEGRVARTQSGPTHGVFRRRELEFCARITYCGTVRTSTLITVYL